MSQYTELLSIEAETLSPDDDNYEESLLKVATLFRGFDEALTAFIKEHGYSGNLLDVGSKAQFLRARFKEANVKPPRDFKDWFIPNKKIYRKTAYQICFAFGLSIAETNEFFRCVQFERGFDCHISSEAIYYFCIKNGLSYTSAQEMIAQIPDQQKMKAIPNREILYTGTIVEYIDSINDSDKLIQYITKNINEFQYNNATIIKYIQALWMEISQENGLAVKEGGIIDRTRNRYENKRRFGETDTRSAKTIADEVRYQEKEIRPEDSVVATANSSTWTMFSQIIGLPNYLESEYAAKYDRSLSFVLSANALMPLNASYCFPSQHNIDKVLRGELGDNELMRKLLILLVFYTYWSKKVIQSNNAYFNATHSDSEGCIDTINKYLVDTEYPKLYAGNPYDWLFMWSLNDDHPLDAFRTYMGEVFAIKEEQLEDGK